MILVAIGTGGVVLFGLGIRWVLRDVARNMDLYHKGAN